MTNEEAIEVLNNWDMACPICEKRKSEEKGVCADCRFNKALDLAIRALQTGEVYMTGEDYNLYIEGYKAGMKDFEPKQGEWINHRNDYGHNIADCSECGKTMQWHDEDEDGIPRYCWYCGAKMQKGDIENG